MRGLVELLRLGTTKEVPPGKMHQFKIKGKELLAVNLDSHFYCLEARCTHAGAPLTEGTLDGDVLTCSWHGSRFRITDGSLVGGPASKPLSTYKIITKDDQLLVEA